MCRSIDLKHRSLRWSARLSHTLEATGLPYELVFVEDGGGDGSFRLLLELQAANPDRIVVIQLMRNYGQHNALMCGFRHAVGELIITLDDDLQNPPEEIPKLIDKIRSGRFDLVYGVYSSKRHSAWRNAGSALVGAFYRFTFQNDVTITSFRAIHRPLLLSILSYDWNFTFVDGLLAWNTQRIGQVEVEHHPRAAGRSGYNVARLIMLALNLFTNFTLLPLRIVSWFGLRFPPAGSAWRCSISSSSFAPRSACRGMHPRSSRSSWLAARNCSPWA